MFSSNFLKIAQNSLNKIVLHNAFKSRLLLVTFVTFTKQNAVNGSVKHY